MTVKKKAAKVEESLAFDEIVIAEGTDQEWTHKLVVPRGKKYQARHLKLLGTFGKLEGIAAKMDSGSTAMEDILQAIEDMFTQKDFDDIMLPFALNMHEEGDRDRLDMLLPLEKFMAYMGAASFIVSGGKKEEVEVALKK